MNEILFEGMIFRCEELCSFFYGETQDLRKLVGLEPAEVPDLSEIIIEAWHTDDNKTYTFEHIFRLYNVVPLEFKHPGDCICCCGGEVKIQFDKIEVCEADKTQVELKDGWFSPEYLKEYYESKTLLNKE
ncbi:MAG: hypothetical protein GTO02_13470 [Candidatus Dadabacteria bacterium]|nr:hypothetical protein [Candidatus Dadabacteria bacterium]